MHTNHFIKKFLAVLLVLGFVYGCKGQDENDSVKNLDFVQTKLNSVDSGQRQQVNDRISSSRTTAITRAVKLVSNAVCGITVTQMQESRYRSPFSDDEFFRFFFRDRFQPVKSLGSGFMISENGFILTNEHVVHNATEIMVSLADGSTHKAKLIGSDYISDVALIRIDGKGYPYIHFGDSDNVIIGEWVIALGNPFGLFEINAKPTVTVGVVSAMDRDFGRQSNDRVYQDMIQTDAAINQGNSGGPLVNSLGDVIGMNTFIYTGGGNSVGSIGLGFAIPINRIKRVLNDLKNNGEVNRKWKTGLVVQDITPIMARYFKLKSPTGVIITDISRNSPASRTDLEVGDIIVEVNGKTITHENQIFDIIENEDLRGGDVLKLKVVHKNEYRIVRLILEGVNK